MDSAYDHIQEESYPDDAPQSQPKDASAQQNNNFNTEIQDAYKAISSSPWAARLGGFLGTVKKQGEQYYNTAQATASSSASAGLSNIIKHTRGLSIQNPDATPKDNDEPASEKSTDPSSPAHPDRPDSLPADIVKEAEGMLSRFRAEAAKRLVDIQKAEDAADEALLKFGTNIKSFLTEAVTIAPPSDEEGGEKGTGKVLFESKDSDGKRVVHATRFDAQLHVIHSSLDSFLRDPASPQWEAWKKDFDVEQKTDAISKDLEKHEELRRAMEKLVPEKVEYATFWERYYFLRYIVETEEQRRREMLKASAPVDDEVSWDEDSEDEEEEKGATPSASKVPQANLEASQGTLKPAVQPRRSNDDKSVADSDASYDLVSGASSRAPGSPQDKKKEAANEESDEEDWE